MLFGERGAFQKNFVVPRRNISGTFESVTGPRAGSPGIVEARMSRGGTKWKLLSKTAGPGRVYRFDGTNVAAGSYISETAVPESRRGREGGKTPIHADPMRTRFTFTR